MVGQKILMSGVDDWVHIPEAVSFARQALGGADEHEALPLAVLSVKQLLRNGLVEVGEIGLDGFAPWVGTYEDLARRIDEAAAGVAFPLLFGDMFWIRNTSLGDEHGETLLAALPQQHE